MTQISSDYVYALFHTASVEGLSVLLVRRQLLRNRMRGKRVPMNVPNWAGQWGLLAVRPLANQAVDEAMRSAVLAQTGVDLSATKNLERYSIVNVQAHRLTGVEDTNISVLLLTCTPEGLAAVAEDMEANVAKRKVSDGVLAEIAIHPISDASSMLVPYAEPQQGWRRFLAGRGLGGVLGGGKALARQLQKRSQMQPSGALAALGILTKLPVELGSSTSNPHPPSHPENPTQTTPGRDQTNVAPD